MKSKGVYDAAAGVCCALPVVLLLLPGWACVAAAGSVDGFCCCWPAAGCLPLAAAAKGVAVLVANLTEGGGISTWAGTPTAGAASVAPAAA